MSPPNEIGARRVSARPYRYDVGPGQPEAREVAVETPVRFEIAGAPFAVMMATPADLEDFAYGFAVTEAIVDDVRDILAVEARLESDRASVAITLAPAALHTHLARKRAIAGRTGCGVCGVGDFDSLPKAKPVAPAPPPAPRAVETAIRALHDAQPLNERTRAAHAAAWCDIDGAILAAREDVGRHNALDKLIGALLRAGVDPRAGFLVITSRCSFEMVVKTARFGAAILVALSAPTSLALETAARSGISLIAIARREGAVAFEPCAPGCEADGDGATT